MEAIKHYADLDVATMTLSSVRWPNGGECPRCGSKENHSYISTRRIWKCKSCRKQFSTKAGTIFEDSPLGLDKWLTAIWMITNDKNGISSYEVHRGLGVTQTTAWFMLHRIRLAAIQTETFERVAGQVEADETFIGGEARNRHEWVRDEKITGTGGKDKTMVVGVLERGGKVRVSVRTSRKKKAGQALVRQNVQPGAGVFTDALKSYEGRDDEYFHQVVDHAIEYVKGHVHTNERENLWSLLKRTFNERKDELGDGGRFESVMKRCAEKRLTYRQLTGKIPNQEV